MQVRKFLFKKLSVANTVEFSGTAARCVNLWETLRRHWNNRKYGASKFRCPHAKEFFRKLSAIWATPSKIFASPGLSRKSVLRDAKLLACPGRHMSRADPDDDITAANS